MTTPRHPRVLALVLAGGRGSRLGPLTEHRAKPALPVAGSHRLVDVVLSNLSHSGISDVWIVEQYLPHSLNDHLANGRPWDLDRTRGGLLVLPPFEGTDGEGFAEGNADALARQAELIADHSPDLVLVASADHLYTLDFRDVVDTHLGRGAALTMVTTTQADDPSRHGVVEVEDGRVTGFAYKPEEPASDVVSAEVFLYDTAVLLETIETLVSSGAELADYGDSLVPHLLAHHLVVEHRLPGYWRDLGTVAGYHQAHRDLLDGRSIDLADERWPVLTSATGSQPVRLEEPAEVRHSLLGGGAEVRGRVRDSVVGRGCRLEPGCLVEDSVLLDGVVVRPGVTVRHAVVDAGAVVEQDCLGEPDDILVVDREGRHRRD
ncbi:NTP transferase domain-containing protein [Auraticoccus sp. F435]|uniref:NTP transferase domain-containing protein n=1 Tax=Auraticoccus cholistanensis TaxID=2656650 RepID=A0A6A9UUS7_9ACTN|nr:sugar phosphate nucleotidyltransferase [Auraticoccus cholistanensis]MVA76696.1 NTP transferase domain-containing protein [Auraticoccus cholistanensis]